MDFTRHFQAELDRRYPPEVAKPLRAAVDSRYRSIQPSIAFARTSSNPMDRRLEFCAYFLAMIQTLEARGETFEDIRTACVNVAHSYVRPANPWQRWVKSLPGKLIGFAPITHLVTRIMSSKTGRKGHPDGFLVQIITDPHETHGLRYGFDILECGICTLFARHGALHYVPILCEVDRLTSSMAGLEMIRGGTIAMGAAKCDFRFKLAQKTQQGDSRP